MSLLDKTRGLLEKAGYQVIFPDTNGVLNYEVGRQFMLEVGYKF